MKNLIFALSVFISLVVQLSAQPIEYIFHSNFNERCNIAPPLVPTSSDTFFTDILTGLGNMDRTVYQFGPNCGFAFDNTGAGNYLGESYSIELYFKFDNTASIARILDFKNRTSDFGLYADQNQLQFYNATSAGTNQFIAGQYVHLVITRDSATQLVSEYVNGQLLDFFTDGAGLAVLDTSNKLIFFQDDLVFGGEANPGAVALLRLYNTTIDSAQVVTAFSLLQNDLTPNSFSVNQVVQCLVGNQYFFSNTSPDTINNTFSWYFDDGDSLVGIGGQHSYLSGGKYDVRLVVTSQSGCMDTVIRIVSVFAPPAVSLGPDLGLCNGIPLSLDPGSYSGYSWNDGSTNQTLTVSQPGIYSVTVTDGNGCTGVDSLTVNVTPIISLGPDSFFCGPVSITLDAGQGFASYLWSDGSTLQTLSVTVQNLYAVTVTDDNGCLNSDSVYLIMLDIPELALGNDTTICQGSSLLLDGGPFNNYLWQDSSVNQQFLVTNSGTYAVRITNFSGCSNYDTISVSVSPLPVVNLGVDSVYCGSVSLTLDAGPGLASYLWSNGSSLQTLTINDSGFYSVMVYSLEGCPGGDTVNFGIQEIPFLDLGNDTSLCGSAALILDAGPVNSYLWQDGATTQTYTATVSGLYSVLITAGSGCSNSDSIYVGIHPLPLLDLGPDTAFCDNISYILDAGNGFANYAWSDGSTLSTLFLNDGGTYTVLVTDTNGCQATDSVVVGKGITPVFDLGNDTTLCSGLSLELDAGSGYSLYQWSTGQSISSISISDSGTYTVLVSDSLGCQSADSVFISLLQSPVVYAGPDTAFCFGGAVLLDAGAGFSSYLWNDSTVLQTNLASQNGIYSVQVSSANGCTAADSVDVTVYPGPMTPNVFVFAGTTLVSSLPDGNQWYNQNGPIPGATNSFYVPSQAGSYYVIVTDTNGCVSPPSNTVVWGLGVFSMEALNIQAYPNPVMDKLYLLTGKLTDAFIKIEIEDVQGRKIVSLNQEIQAGHNQLILDLNSLQPGIYLLQLTTNGGKGVTRFVKD